MFVGPGGRAIGSSRRDVAVYRWSGNDTVMISGSKRIYSLDVHVVHDRNNFQSHTSSAILGSAFRRRIGDDGEVLVELRFWLTPFATFCNGLGVRRSVAPAVPDPTGAKTLSVSCEVSAEILRFGVRSSLEAASLSPWRSISVADLERGKLINGGRCADKSADEVIM